MITDLQNQKFKNSRFYKYFDMLISEVIELEKRGVVFYFFQSPLKQNIKGLTDFELKRLRDWQFDFNNISESDCEIIKEIYPADITLEYLKQLYDGSKVYKKNGVRYLADFRSKYVNIIMGKRVTFYQPDTWNNRIYIYGQCTARGTGVEDKHTICSFLQNEINKYYPNSFQVVNSAIGCGSDLFDDIKHMKESQYKSGDIVILCTNLEIVPVELFEENKIAYYDTSSLFCRPHDYGEWFTDSTFHTNMKGNRVIAKYIYSILKKDNVLITRPNKKNFEEEKRIIEVEDDEIDSEELQIYLTELSKHKKIGKNGCVVMNCNPFTKGHQYLIDYAAGQVDNLYVFVVEENRSFFPFSDRLKLVQEGTSHLPNVEVFPSGKFMISALTFPGYFLKDGNKDISVDVTMDVKIFGKYIAPALDIRVRFVGEEPNDFVTRKYNEEMAEVLPFYGIELEIIKRKEQNKRVVSASLVRELLKEKNFDQIEDLVPLTTFKYLKEKYG